MSKFTRVLKFTGGFHTISHNGETYAEEHEGTGLFEVPHAHADHFVASGFAEDFATDMEAALEKLTSAEGKPEGAAQAASAAKRGKL